MSGRKPVFRFGAGGSAKNTKDPQVNFVFQLPGGGTSTPGGFNFAPPITPTATPSFNFGANAASPAPAFGNAASSFGAAPPPSTPTNQQPSFNFSTQPAKPSPLGFGASSAAQNASVFGAPSQASPFGAQPSTPTGTFGPAAQNTSFSFGASNPPAIASPFDKPSSITTPTSSVPSSQFAFGSNQPASSPFGTASNNALQSPLRRAVSDVSGLNQNSPLNKPTFASGNVFGGMAATSTPSATNPPSVAPAAPSSTSFAFGSTSSGMAATTAPATSSVPTTSTTGFSFGASSATPASPAINVSTSGFSFGASSPASTPTKTEPPKAIGGFSFGAPSTPPVTSTATSKPFFSFTKSTESDTKATPVTTPTSEVKKVESSAFSFLKPETSTAATTTSTSTTSSAPTFSFNSTSTPKADQTPSLLTSKPADGGSAAKTFTFGTSTASTTSATTAAPTTSTVPKFTFGSSTSDKKADTATTSGAATTAVSAAPAIPTIQVPAQPAQPSEFSFDKILEQMKLTSISMPQEIQFSLANAGMPGKMIGQQAMILQSTTFPFDKIEPTTRHSELPDDARNQLDEVEKYMKSEMQVCDFLTKNKMVSKAEQIQRVKKDTESLTKQMEGLHSRLQGHLEIIEQLWNGVDYQHRNVVQASEIVDNYKKSNQQSRWSFGYGVHNNYFALLARNFEIRLERYRQNIVDIEATITSMSRHKNVRPKDVTDTMRLQHDSLLRSTGRVVEIHEDLEIHKQRYKQYHELLYGQVVDPLNERSNRPLSDFQEYLQPLPSTS